MDKLLNVMESIGSIVAAEFSERGGVVRDGERHLAPADVGSLNGALTPMLWMAGEFFDDFGLDFPKVSYRPEVDSMTGFVADSLLVSGSVSPAVFMFSDFLKNELLCPAMQDLNLSDLLANFRAWALEHAGDVPVPPSPAVVLGSD